MRTRFIHSYKDIISVENLLEAWKEFVRSKRKRADLKAFSQFLMHNILQLHQDLKDKTYTHGGYEHFKINDPKPRDIHKARFRDRLLHHARYRKLYSFFDHTFIADSYSCREEKGTHKAMARFRSFAHRVSKNNTRTCWVLKCDIRKFFASIDQEILLRILSARIADARLLTLLENVIGSFHSTALGKGLPLGNLTSQLLVNVYMNEFDQFVKHEMKAKHYIRYADDFVLFSHDKNKLVKILPYMEVFLRDRLALKLHPDKVFIKTLASGVDFLGWVHFPDHRVLRTTTKRRMLRRIGKIHGKNEMIDSYLGLLLHGNTYRLHKEMCGSAKIST